MDRADICKRIPHAGDMCLLDQVVDWNDQEIVCTAVSHRDPGNPLRGRDGLHAVTAVEYAGQAMALHGGLLDSSSEHPRKGYLASVRDLKVHHDRLDDQSADLTITARRLAGGEDSFMYEFDVSAHGTLLVSGRAAVKLLERMGA